MALQQHTVVAAAKKLFFFSSSSSLLLANPSSSLHLISYPQKRTKKQQLGFGGRLRCSIEYNDLCERAVYPRPSEIPWKKEISNSVQLVGNVGTPVQIKHLSSVKAVAWTRLAVKTSVSDTLWINLTLWDELAHVAFEHVEKGHRIYVSGRLVSDTVEGDDGKLQTYYKVVVQQLNFVESSFSPAPLYEHDTNSTIAGGKIGSYATNNAGSTEELWQAFFANPVEWWDNRNNKRNPKYPDFKHKDTGEALWVEGKYNPAWIKPQLAILDSKMAFRHTQEASTTAFMVGDDFNPF